MEKPRPSFRCGLLALFTITLGGPVHADDYPAKPIKILSPFSAGGTPDALGRIVAQQLTARFNHSVTIENRPGGGQTIATKAAATASADGYTLLQVSNALTYTTVLYSSPGYDPIKSFAPVATLASWSHLLVVPASVPAATVQDLIAYAKANPGRASIAVVGGAPHVLAGLFRTASEAPFNIVPYRQQPQLIADLLAGRIHAFFGAGAGLISLVQRGELRALAYTGVTRHRAFPDVPTVTEIGLAQLALNPSDWTGILAPAGTQADAIATLNAGINAALQTTHVQASILQQGGEIKMTSPQEFAAFLAAEAERWPSLARATGFRPD
jgi:tripartite-type tricarboxylate transporter receptor subunit TctC